jgi:hypothetical protein
MQTLVREERNRFRAVIDNPVLVAQETFPRKLWTDPLKR